MSNKYNNVGVYEHTVSFYLNDDDGSVKIFTAPSLDFTSYAYDMVEVNDLEEL